MSVFTGASVLITGGTGAFGRAFARHLLDHHHPRRICLFSRDEAKQAALKANLPDTGPVRYFLGDVRDEGRLLRACAGQDIVIHAAAMKRVESCEAEPLEAVRTNVRGTENVAGAAIANDVPRVVFLSTDKAASPLTLYGATKFTAEQLMIQANAYSAGSLTRFACTRYGNVHGSTGSVVPLFRRQYAHGEPFTVTSLRMTRFWMRMTEAVRLVEYAAEHMRGGEVFIPKLRAISIAQLCDAIGPGHPVTEIGLRSREKLHEELVALEEARDTYDRGEVLLVQPPHRTWEDASPEPGTRVPEDFRYTSDRVPRIPAEELRAMLAED